VHGLRRIEPDPSAWLIGLMERLGLVWDVVRIAPERQQAKLAATPTLAVTD
jgi:stearoyl-CoA desaturase (delta-9 desaturase)